MQTSRTQSVMKLLMAVLLLAMPAFATVHVSEVMADNDNTLMDVDGGSSDWIELYNDSASSVSLDGWHLTDTATQLTQWTFPATNIAAKGFVLVYASGKDRAVAGAELHANFQLSASGESVLLVQPDGSTVESQLPFPAQLEDVSFGYASSGGATTSTVTLVDAGAICTARIPTSSGDADGWTATGFDDSGWLSGTTGIGFERVSGYEALIGLDVEADMYNHNASLYIRIPFTFDSNAPADLLQLDMKFDDGFAAYINDTLVASSNAPVPLDWDSGTGISRADSLATVFQPFDISAFSDALQNGTNVLAIHGLNIRSSSSDLLFIPRLVSDTITNNEGGLDLSGTGMLEAPTPGAPNTAIAYTGACEMPRIAPERGFYESPIQVSITNLSDGATVRYTTDGSIPTESTGSVYSNSISIQGTTLLRAAAFRSGYKPSDANTQTYLFIDEVLQQDGSGLQPAADWGHDGPDWEVDPSMTNSVFTDTSGQTFTLTTALQDLPTVSLVTDWDNWWSDEDGPTLPDGLTPWLGIYADTVGENAVRRPVSMEFFTPDGLEEFTGDGVVSIVGGGIGGTSADRWKSDKLSMRVSFTEKLNHPVYGDDAAQKFNTLVLDAHLAWTWTHPTSSQQSAVKLITDAIASDYQNRMGKGKGAPHSRFVHLYLNGLYWGLYEMHERPDEHFAAEYYGGQNEDYDSIKHWATDTDSEDSDHDGDPYNDHITNGDDVDYNAMLALSRSDLTQSANYDALAAKLEIDILIDYLLVNFYLGNNDWAHKNWYATSDQVGSDPRWRYHSWDVEHVMETGFYDPDLAGALDCDVTGKDDSGGPTEVHQNLSASATYKLLFADHIHRHFFNGGTLSAETATALFWARVEEIEWAMLGEAARWGDSYNPHGYSEWVDHMEDLRDIYFMDRSTRVLTQLKSRGLYPDTDAPEFSVQAIPMHGGRVATNDAITIISTHPVYYTTDGSDPCADGAIAGTLYTSALTINQPTLLKARAQNGAEWSALSEAVFWTDDIPLAVTELMYHAPGGNAQDFIELRNISTETVQLLGYKLDSAIDYHFRDSATASLVPGEFIVAIKDIDQFSAAYSTNGLTIAGEYKGDFDNSGEKVELEFWDQDLITFRYSDARNWPQAADGAGHSLVPLNDAVLEEEERGSLNYGGNWCASTDSGGSPGMAAPVPGATVLLNEITAHTDTGEDPPFESNDQIELYNPTASDIVLNGWTLSDDLDERDKWAIPDGTVVPATGFVLFDENDFHPDRTNGFGLDKAGEQVVLSSPDRVVDAIRFKGQGNGLSLGRYPDGSSEWLTTLPSPSAPNQLPATEVRISALMYNPPIPAGYPDGDDMEYIQLENMGSQTVPFENSAGTWRIDGGVSYAFASGTALPPDEKLWLVSFDPADTTLLNLFCTTNGLNAASETILGPYEGQLSNEGERVAVERPQESDDPLQPLDVSWVIVDELFYFDQSPWPSGADGTGYPLFRTGLSDWSVPTPDDMDCDQMDDAWETACFGSLNEKANDDWDLDGYSNLEEQICGTHPTNGMSYFVIEDMATPPLRWNTVTGRTYSVYWTDDLQHPFTRIASGLSTNMYSDTLHPTNGYNYYYITVEME
jgi:CotH kinase protein/Lamin Tail Domain/Chitobiase/beta-hexosaminidase C-terminal domain/Fn3 associated